MIRPVSVLLSESANICYNLDFADFRTFGSHIQFDFFLIFHFVVRKLKRDTHFISFACTEI